MNTEITLCQSRGFLLQLFPECLSREGRRPSTVAAKDSGTFYYKEGLMCDSEKLRREKIQTGGFILAMLSQKRATNKKPIDLVALLMWLGIAVILAVTLLLGGCEHAWGSEITTEASYYTRASVLAEGNSGICANGEALRDDGEYTFAHATLPFGSKIRITRLDRPELSVIARCTDRGPSAYLRRQGRAIDVNLSCAKALELTRDGVAMVTVEVI